MAAPGSVLQVAAQLKEIDAFEEISHWTKGNVAHISNEELENPSYSMLWDLGEGK